MSLQEKQQQQQIAGHKRNFDKFIDTQYDELGDAERQNITMHFQSFLDLCLDMIPDAGQPADLYMFNSHMGAMVRELDTAKEHFAKALLAFRNTRGNGMHKE